VSVSTCCFGSAQLFSVIVFGCISSQGWDKDRCRYNGDANACSFGTVVGVMAFFGLIILLVVDALFENISGVQHRKYAVIGDMGFSGRSSRQSCVFNKLCARGDTICLCPPASSQYLHIYSSGGTCSGMLAI